MSGFFQALVVGGAAISAVACSGQSASVVAGGGGSGASGGAGAQGGATSGAGGAKVGGAGGGQAGMSSGGTGILELGGSGGEAGAGPLPEPGATAQWDCSELAVGSVCVDVLGTTATKLPSDCPVDATRPRSAADCGADEQFTCYLAVTAAGETTLVNCECSAGLACSACTGVLGGHHGEAMACDGKHKVCACAFTGILIPK